MIRQAQRLDKDRVVELCRDSRSGAGFDDPDALTGFTFPYDPDYAAMLFMQHLASPGALCLVYVPQERPEGVLMAVSYRHPFGPVHLAKETLWWIDPAYRGSAAIRMLDAYEAWARERNCVFAGMAGMGDDPEVGKLYRRRGYKAAEVHYLKRL